MSRTRANLCNAVFLRRSIGRLGSTTFCSSSIAFPEEEFECRKAASHSHPVLAI
ncbi:MAG: hypothetical protein GTO42_12300 [Candidatus Latescibacteria bacterium]|nr:hypothetical protein [Candidatus Latescibacterota bacterium]NIO30039.1 hypothetical protein [Candidatus Latescibacterota bacterium]NIO57654.1 hypothetical protein [Candidatus Latescibacterota bacterium]NIT39836.1 hypothetical protein [Candidatus Latescibacterota bacterium]